MQIPAMLRSRFRFAGDLARAAEVAGVLAKYGLATWLADVEWEPLRNALKSHNGEILAQHPFEVRVRLALTDLGTTFIKVGQMLSTRPELVGGALASELTKLQSSTPPDSPEVATQAVETELGRPISECFKSFEGIALASASIGQAHEAHLKNGRRALVKIQHPGIEGIVRRDLDILQFLAGIAEKNSALHQYQPVGLIREFSRTMLNELDFRREMRNLQAFRRNFSGNETIYFPKPYPDLTTGRVLTMEYVKGFTLDDNVSVEKLKINRKQLAKNGANAFVEMIFRDGFYHADPHPGNFLIIRDGRICLLDAGMVGRIDNIFQKQIEDILMAAGDQDAQRMVEAVTRACGSPPDLDRAALSADLSEFFVEYGTTEIGTFNVSGALTNITSILHEHKLFLPGKLSMLIKCLILLEGTGRLLSPSFSLAELLLPWRKTIVMRRFSPEELQKNFRRLYGDWERLAETAPKIVGDMLEKMEKGNLTLRVEHRHIKSHANRLVAGLFISSLLLASSILIATNMRPTIHGISAIGLSGYIISVAFGFRMLLINRDKRVSQREGDWD